MQPGLAMAAARAALALVSASPQPPAPSACPSVEAVWADDEGLVGHERVVAPPGRPTLSLEDLGARYRVTVAGRAHDYEDAARDCPRRAQVAAVFVGLTLWPLELAAPPAEAPAPAPRRARPPVEVEVAPWLGLAAASGQAHVAPTGGVSLRAAVMGARFGAVAGLGADWPIALDVRGVAVAERRFPLDVGVRARAGGERLGAVVDASLGVTLVRAAPERAASSSSWIDPGARLGGTLEVRVGRRAAAPAGGVFIFMGAFAEISPLPRRLGLEPDGVVGQASWLRAGGTLGVRVRIP